MVAFSSLQELMDEYNKSSRRKTRAERQDLHLGATCKKCMVCPIAGRCYRYNLGSKLLRIYTFEIIILIVITDVVFIKSLFVVS